MPSPKLMEILPSTRLLDIRIQAVVLSHLRSKIRCLFPQLSDHALDFDISLFDDHITHLIREIAKLFLRMRLHKAAKLHHVDDLSQHCSGETQITRTIEKSIHTRQVDTRRCSCAGLFNVGGAGRPVSRVANSQQQ